MNIIRQIVEDSVGRTLSDVEYEAFMGPYRGGLAGHGWLGDINAAMGRMRDDLHDQGLLTGDPDEE